MVVKRGISIGKCILAGILTVLIFCLGLTLGFIFDTTRIKSVETAINERDTDYTSLQFQYLYLDTLKNTTEGCAVLDAALKNTIAELGESMDRFLEYKEATRFNKKEYDVISRKYLLNNLRYWLFAQKSKSMCNLDSVTILYFYSEKYCGICPNQGVILTYFKKLFGDSLLVFPIDIDFKEKEPMVSILISRYNITEYPTLITEDKKYSGIVEKERLGSMICGLFREKRAECASYESQN